MIAEFVITFREALEAALIIGIILGFLVKTRQTKYNNTVYVAIASGIIASVAGAVAFGVVAGGFSGPSEELFEGIVMLIGAALLTTMIFWMMKQKHIAHELQSKIASKIEEASKAGLFFLVFVSILREGIETVIFLWSADFASGAALGYIGALAGIVAAATLGYMIFVAAMRVNLKKFFNVTGVLLILFAAGLVAQGVHEFNEFGLVPPVIEHVWDINPPLNPDGSYPALHEKGYAGGIAAGLFGYNGNPSLSELMGYAAYIVVVVLAWKLLIAPRKDT